MPLVPAKCPECGGLIEVDNEKRAGFCQHCGNPFVVEDAIQTFNTVYNITNNYNTTNVTNNNTNIGEGAVVNIYEDKAKDFFIEASVLRAYIGASVDVVIPDGVTEIAEGCFENLKIKSVTIPDTVEIISDYAFYNCTCLEAVYITDLVNWCNISFGEESANPLCNSCDLYIDGELATDITIPDEVETINARAFDSCVSLNAVTLGNNITNINSEAFVRCYNLTSVNFPDTDTKINIDKLAFLGTPYQQKLEDKAKEKAERERASEVEENKKIVQEILKSVEIFKSEVAKAVKTETENLAGINNSQEYIDKKIEILQSIADEQVEKYEKAVNDYLTMKYNFGCTVDNAKVRQAEIKYQIIKTLWENGGKLSNTEIIEKLQPENISATKINQSLKSLVECNMLVRSEIARCAYFESLSEEDLDWAKWSIENEHQKAKEKEYTINKYYSVPCPQMPVASDVIKLPEEPQKNKEASYSVVHQSQYRSQGLCQHCGGKFKGLFGKKCAKCGKPKDY